MEMGFGKEAVEVFLLFFIVDKLQQALDKFGGDE